MLLGSQQSTPGAIESIVQLAATSVGFPVVFAGALLAVVQAASGVDIIGFFSAAALMDE